MRDKFITAEVIADSLNTHGNRVTSFLITCPRIVLAEFNTHRVLSRNSASSRAVPFDVMVEKVTETPFIPIRWQEDHKGMQGRKYLSGRMVELADGRWLAARDAAVQQAKYLNKNIRVTKQLCNRLLEPFMYHTIIVTATEWENFFALRAHEAAEIHIQNLAFKMLEAYNKSEPKQLESGQWHIPFGDRIDQSRLTEVLYKLNGESVLINSSTLEQAMVEVAVARCARVSYLNYEGTDDYEKDLKLANRLASMGHWSPFEHCAKAMTNEEFHAFSHSKPIYNDMGDAYAAMGSSEFGWTGNFRGFVQYRKTFEGENRKDNRVEQKA